MSDFDLTGGPWGFRLRTAADFSTGFDVYIEPDTFTNQPLPQLEGTIHDQTIYAGTAADGEVLIDRHNWYNQGAQYRAVSANFAQYPNVTVVDYINLYHAASLLPVPELAISRAGQADLSTLLPLLSNSTVVADEFLTRSILALLSSCAATPAQRTELANAIGLTGGMLDVLMNFGVLLREFAGLFSTADIDAIKTTLALFPAPVVDQLHLIVMDESTLALTAAGGFASGGMIDVAVHATSTVSFLPYPNGGGQVPDVNQLQEILTHEIGHMLDSASVRQEADRYTNIYNAGGNDPNAYLYEHVFSPRTEDIIFYWIGYCTDSATVLNAVGARGNAVLSQKLSHVIDMLPSLTPSTAPFFATDPVSRVTTVITVPVKRGPALYLGDDGMITAVNGITF